MKSPADVQAGPLFWETATEKRVLRAGRTGGWTWFPSTVQVSTGAYKRQVHEVPLGKQVTEAMVIEKITWASWTR